MMDRVLKISKDARMSGERWLHALRRRAAKRMLSEYEGSSVLVLCHGNMCRSPFAEAVLRAALPAAVEVRSAGFVAPGRCAPPDAVSAARRFGVDLSKHCSRLITPGLVRAFGLIVVMEPGQARELINRFGTPRERILVLGDFDSLPIESRSIADPILQSRDVFIDCYERIDRCARELSRVLHRAARARAPLYGERDLASGVPAPQVT